MVTPHARDRSGLSLIEILVVIAIIGLLVGLLIPAIQSSRESARRVVCQDRLRQVGLAVIAHESARGTLPRLYNGAFLPQPRTAIDEFHFHSWRTAILPGVEQQATFAALNFDMPATVASNQTAVNVGIEVFVCPSARNPTRIVPEIGAWNDGDFPVAWVGTAARSDHEAVVGVQVARQTNISTDLSIIRFGAWGEATYDTSNGAALRYRVARLSDLRDGLSNTILIGERAGRPDEYRRGEPVTPYRDPTTGMDHHQAAWAISTHIWWTVLGLDQGVNETNRTGIFSFHPGGAHVALADGSVRFLKDTTNPTVLKALATRAGSEVVQFVD